MKVVVFDGSPSAGRGATHMMTQAFLAGVEDAGARTETIYLSKQKIQHCMACSICWVKTPGQCVLKDDMAELQSKYFESDISVFASPLFVDNVTGYMKIFMDRLWFPMIDHHFEKDEEYGECRHPRRQTYIPKMVAMANCGCPEQGQFAALRVLYRRIARNFGIDFMAEIYRGGGALLFNPEAGFEAEAKEYMQLLKTAGHELIQQSGFSNKTKMELEKPYLPESEYVERYTKTFEKIMDQRIGKQQGLPN